MGRCFIRCYYYVQLKGGRKIRGFIHDVCVALNEGLFLFSGVR